MTVKRGVAWDDWTYNQIERTRGESVSFSARACECTMAWLRVEEFLVHEGFVFDSTTEARELVLDLLEAGLKDDV